LATKKQWEEWNQDPKIKQWKEGKEAAGKRRLARKMQFTSSLQKYEQYHRQGHDLIQKSREDDEQDELNDEKVEWAYMRLVIVFILIVSTITGGLLYLST
jgi:hypothetical protein